MKQKNMELVSQLLISAVAVILAGIIIYRIKLSVDSTIDATGKIVENTNDTASEYTDYKITMYDGEEIRGNQVVNFIKKQLGDYDSTETAPIYVEVVTAVSGTTYTNTYVNKEHITDIKDFSSLKYYIKPTAAFRGEVIKSANEAILGVKFVQK